MVLQQLKAAALMVKLWECCVDERIGTVGVIIQFTARLCDWRMFTVLSWLDDLHGKFKWCQSVNSPLPLCMSVCVCVCICCSVWTLSHTCVCVCVCVCLCTKSSLCYSLFLFLSFPIFRKMYTEYLTLSYLYKAPPTHMTSLESFTHTCDIAGHLFIKLTKAVP